MTKKEVRESINKIKEIWDNEPCYTSKMCGYCPIKKECPAFMKALNKLLDKVKK